MAQNLLLRPSGYYFRYIIRSCHRPLLSIKELRYTLSTSSRRLAGKRARAVAAKVEALLERLARTQRVLTDKQIRQTIRQYVDEAGEQFSDAHLQSPPRNHADREGGIDFLEDQVAGLHSALANSNYTGKQYVYDAESFSGDIQAEVCSLFGLDATKVDRGDIQFLRACQAWTAATKQLYEDHLKRLHGEVVEPKRASVTSEIPKAPKAPLVSEVIEPFLSDRSKRKDIEERTASGYRQFVQLFIDIMGDVPVTAVTPAVRRQTIWDQSARFLRDTFLPVTSPV